MINSNSATSIDQFPVSINDLKDRYYDGQLLSQEEFKALKNFDTYRLNYLNLAANEEEFGKRYLELQAKANLAPYSEFLQINL